MDQQLPDDELDAIAAQGGGQNAPVPAPISSPPPAAPAIPVAAPPQAPPALVPPGTTAVKGSRAVETPTPTPEMRQGLQDEQKVIADQRKLAGDEAATEGEKARIEQERAEKLSEETDRQNAQILADQQAKRDLAEKINNDRLAAIDRLQQTAPPGGFEDWHGEKKVRGYLAIALGGLARGNSGGVNTALQQIEKQVEDQRKAYTADLEKQYKVLELKHGVDQDMLQSATESVADGYIRKAMALDSLNKQADAQLKALGIPAAAQAGIKAQLGFDKQAADAMQKYGMIKQTDTTQFVPGGHRTGGGGGAGVVDLVKMAESGSPRSAIVARAQQMGIPEKTWKNQVDLAFSEREKGLQHTADAEAKRAGEDEKRAVRDPSGTVIGYAGGSRPNVQAIQDRYVQYKDAIKSLEDLKASGDTVPVGSNAYDRAVLAVAATTTANPSDRTTAHEAGTIKKWGLINNKAIDKTLEHLKERRDEFMAQLRPVELPAEKQAAPGGAEPPKKQNPVREAIRAMGEGRGL